MKSTSSSIYLNSKQSESNIFLNTNAKEFSSKEKEHNTASTSIESFKHLNKTNQRLREKGRVYEAIKLHGPTTSRKLAYITGIERSSVCRALFDKLREITPAIKESHIAKCETTGIKVKHYSVIDFILEGGKHG